MDIKKLQRTESNHYIFPNSVDGVKAYLKDDCDGKLTKESEFIPDPHINNVWKVTNIESHKHTYDAIVYLTAGKMDSLTHQIQERNDFEFVNRR